MTLKMQVWTAWAGQNFEVMWTTSSSQWTLKMAYLYLAP